MPSVVYGFFAFIYIGPLVVEFGEYAFAEGWIDEPPNVLNPINGAIVVGVMILPLVASMSEDALRAVPNELREGSLALGATKIETTFKVMIQASLSANYCEHNPRSFKSGRGDHGRNISRWYSCGIHF